MEELDRVMANFYFLVNKLGDYVEENEDITDEEVDEINFAIKTIREALLK